MPRAASVNPASTSAGTRDRSMGSTPRITGSVRCHPRQRPAARSGTASPPHPRPFGVRSSSRRPALLRPLQPPDHRGPRDQAAMGCGRGRPGPTRDQATASPASPQSAGPPGRAQIPPLAADDLSAAMLAQLRTGPRGRAREVMPLLAAAEELPLRPGCLDLVTAFNCVHHFDLDRFLAAAARVLKPGGQMFIYTRTPQQNARTIWGRYFPGFTEHEQRLHSEAALRDAVQRADGLQMAATQTFQHQRTSTAERLAAQAEGYHYSTFSFYSPQELRAAITTFLARLPSEQVSWVDEHLL